MPSTIQVQNTPGYNQFSPALYGHNNFAYGVIPAGDYTLGDTLQFVGLGASAIAHAKFIANTGEVLEIFSSADLSNAVAWNIAAAYDIAYIIHFVKGVGVDLKITVT